MNGQRLRQRAFFQKDGEHGDLRWCGMGGESGEDDPGGSRAVPLPRGEAGTDGCWLRLHVSETRDICRY